MAPNRGNNGSFAQKLGSKLGFNLSADGVDWENGGADELAQEEAVENTAPADMPHYGAEVGDVIRPQDVEKAGELMCEVNDRIYKMNIHMQEAAMNADNMELAEQIGERWGEFTDQMGADQTFRGEATFVNGIKQAVMAYNEIVYDVNFMVNCDPNTALEVRLNPEAVTSLGRAKAGVHVQGEGELGDLVRKVENDLAAAYSRDVSHDPSLQTSMQFGA